MNKISLASALTLSLVLISPALAQQSTVRFQCDAGPQYICYFTIYFRGGAGGVKNFTMRGHTGDSISGVDPAHDIYCVCFNGQPPGFPSQCASRGCYGPRNIHAVND